ncbi:MAG TPA: NUDIX domain-containing protein [Gammaproteobacteria bacterium]|nr:NUDIX domain-containing protein [Gammaproteobacteria bacterium]
MKPLLTPFNEQDVELLHTDQLYRGIFTLVRHHIKHRKFNGEWSNTFTRELLERKSAVGVLLYDPTLDKVILIEQFRAGALGREPCPWLLEVVAGVYDSNEAPAEVAEREALEEAGSKILDLEPICEYFVSPGGSNEYLHLFCGRIDASNAGGVHGLLEEHEDIRAFTLSSDEAFAYLQDGHIKTSPAIISLLWLQQHRERLKQLWQTTQ